ncbi:MAG TPA: class I SAM-dependent methyltransferase [Verrucomicrobiae bacterium]
MADHNSSRYGDSVHLEKLRQLLPGLMKTARGIRGFLSEKEMKFLAMVAACPTAQGVILEIGSFLGKSTSILAAAGQLAPGTRVVAVDPLDYRPSFDPKRGKESCLEDLKANLRLAQVEPFVEVHQMRSQELEPLWNRDRKIRFLWIDGDHSYEGAKSDFDLFAPFLADGAIVALHDCFKHDVGPMRVLAEDLLLSKNFGAAGACGSIGWAQFRANAKDCEPFTKAKLQFYQRIVRLIPRAYLDPIEHGTNSAIYKLMRSFVPHGEMDPANWAGQVAFCAGQ